jgi:hypothetical protein
MPKLVSALLGLIPASGGPKSRVRVVSQANLGTCGAPFLAALNDLPLIALHGCFTGLPSIH